MAISFLLLAICLIFPSFVSSTRTLQNPELVVQEVNRELNSSRRKLGYLSCGTGNSIDDCWRCVPNWEQDRYQLAKCGIGFGKYTVGGKNGEIYKVTDSSDDDPINPKPGTLRHAIIQDDPLWIIFAHDMVIYSKEELIMNSYKTIDGRGSSVHITGRSCITVQGVTDIIIHAIYVIGCVPGGNTEVRSSPTHFGYRTQSDGDGISIFNSSNVWVDHCTLSNCTDGLIDAIQGSTDITISNNLFTYHDKVMLLGASDSYTPDKNMRVTIAFNVFGEELGQRMPRGRYGFFHVVNNIYPYGWKISAIGGSASATFLSQGNKYVAPNNPNAKQVSFRENFTESVWKDWNWKSSGDLMENGAYFVPSGSKDKSAYYEASSLSAKSCYKVEAMTASAGTLNCKHGMQC